MKKEKSETTTASLLAEEFKAPEKDSREVAKERLKNLKYNFPRYSTLSRLEKVLIEAGFEKYGEDGANLVRRYCVTHLDNDHT